MANEDSRDSTDSMDKKQASTPREEAPKSKLRKYKDIFQHLEVDTHTNVSNLRIQLDIFEDLVERCAWPLNVLRFKRSQDDTADLTIGTIESANSSMKQALQVMSDYFCNLQALLDALPKVEH